MAAEALGVLRKLAAAEAAYADALGECKGQAAAVFREARRQMGLTQRQLAAELGVHHSYVSQIEAGRMYPGRRVLSGMRELLERQGSPDGPARPEVVLP